MSTIQFCVSLENVKIGCKSHLTPSLQGESVYVSRELIDVGGMEGRFTFSTSKSGSSISRTSFSLDIRDVANHKKNLLSIQSFIGGISSQFIFIIVPCVNSMSLFEVCESWSLHNRRVDCISRDVQFCVIWASKQT